MEGGTDWEESFPAIFSTVVQFVIGGRPEGLIHNDGVSLINPEFLQFPPALEVVSLLRQRLLIFLAADDSFGESVLLNNQLQPFPTAIQKDFVV